jgi:uncharacterized protein (DUF2141 family)
LISRLLTFVLLCTSGLLSAQAYSIDLTVRGFKESNGSLMAGVFDNADDFKAKENPVNEAKKVVSDTVMAIRFSGIRQGNYAIAIYHDQNDDQRLNTKKLGIPLEGVGFSGTSRSKVKPPNFQQASFRLQKDTTIVIRIKYP